MHRNLGELSPTKNTSSRKRRITSALALSASLLLSACGSEFRASDSTTTVLTPPSLESVPLSVEVSPSVHPSLNTLRGDRELPPFLGELLAEQVVRVDANGGSCTGMVVNGYLLAAAHCIKSKETGEGAGSISYRFWQDNFEYIRGYASSWALNNEPLDVFVAKLDPNSDQSHGWYVPVFSDLPPEKGTPFAIASLALGANPPIVAHLTYIGGDAARYVFAVDPDNEPNALVNACQPGGSGSFITDGYGNIAVLSGVQLERKSDGTLNEWYAGAKSVAEDTYDADLTGVKLICFGTPVTRATIDGFVNALDPKPGQ